MSHADLEAAIEAAWKDRETITPGTGGTVREAVETALGEMDEGRLRVAEKGADGRLEIGFDLRALWASADGERCRRKPFVDPQKTRTGVKRSGDGDDCRT